MLKFWGQNGGKGRDGGNLQAMFEEKYT